MGSPNNLIPTRQNFYPPAPDPARTDPPAAKLRFFFQFCAVFSPQFFPPSIKYVCQYLKKNVFFLLTPPPWQGQVSFAISTFTKTSLYEMLNILNFLFNFVVLCSTSLAYEICYLCVGGILNNIIIACIYCHL